MDWYKYYFSVSLEARYVYFLKKLGQQQKLAHMAKLSLPKFLIAGNTHPLIISYFKIVTGYCKLICFSFLSHSNIPNQNDPLIIQEQILLLPFFCHSSFQSKGESNTKITETFLSKMKSLIIAFLCYILVGRTKGMIFIK